MIICVINLFFYNVSEMLIRNLVDIIDFYVGKVKFMFLYKYKFILFNSLG